MYQLTLKPGKEYILNNKIWSHYVTMIELKSATKSSDIHTVYIETEETGKLLWHLSESTGCMKVNLNLAYQTGTIVSKKTLGPDEVTVHGYTILNS